ncbi:MAG: sugar ABC transporter permease, partial [Candidatus Heimdallarchaeota archaeon]|nr:sugar ABC transporter permease [Candidatus Heimdallarchaeota archaeon]
MIIAVVFFIVAYIIIPLLTNNEVLSGPNVRSKLFSLIGGLIIAVYLSILRLIESSELSRYFTLLILGIILLILPILRIWQLKYDFSGSDGYVDYDGPPWIPEGADPIINPLLLIPGYHPDYLEGVEGSAIFRNIAIVLMMIAAISVIMSSFVLVRKQLREGIPINDEDGRLLDSQYDITLIHHKISTKINNVLSIDMDKHTQNIQKGYSALLLPFEHVLYGIQRILYNLSRSKTKTEPSSPKLKGVAPLDSLLSLVIYILYLVVPFTQYLFGIVMTILSLGLYRKKGKGRVSLNKIISHMGTIVLISLIFIFLSLDGFHGLGNLFGQPGLYIAFFIAIHFIYLSADPLLRQRLSKTKLAYVFVLPTIAILLFELYFPILVALYLSFQDIRQYPFSNYDELITTSNVGFDNYKFIVDKNLAAIVFIFVITAIVVAKVLNSLNNETNTRRRLLGKFFTIAIWISTLYWTITLNFAVNYENYIEQEVSIFISPSPLPVFINTIKWTLVCVTFHMIIGTTLGMLMNTKFKGRGIVRALMIIPWAVPNFITISIFS